MKRLQRTLLWITGCSCLPAALCAAAEPLLQPLPASEGLSGAGCSFTRASTATGSDSETQLVMVVAAKSQPDQSSSVARVLIAGQVHLLDWVYTGDQAPFTYAKPSVQLSITARSWVDDPDAPACADQGECEGSFHLAQLQVQLGKQVEQVQVKVHCGA